MGRAALNIAHDVGATIIATTRKKERFDVLKELGAQRCEIETPDLSRDLPDSKKIDAVLDLVGNTTFMDSLKMLRRGGRMCLAGWLGGLDPVNGFNPLLQMPSGVYFTFFGSFVFGTPQFPVSDIPMQEIVDKAAAGVFKRNPPRFSSSTISAPRMKRWSPTSLTGKWLFSFRRPIYMPKSKINRCSRSRRLGGMRELVRIILPLQKQGVEVVCAPLPLTTLGDDVSALDRLWARVEGDIVLVGHAYAGAVIGAARHERVKLLVYVAALAPDEGETVADVFYRESPHPHAPKLAPDSNGFIWMPPEGFESAFAQDATSDVKSTLFATQRPINVKCIQEKSPPAPCGKTSHRGFSSPRMIG